MDPTLIRLLGGVAAVAFAYAAERLIMRSRTNAAGRARDAKALPPVRRYTPIDLRSGTKHVSDCEQLLTDFEAAARHSSALLMDTRNETSQSRRAAFQAQSELATQDVMTFRRHLLTELMRHS